MADVGILGFGAYVPTLRIDRAAIAAANAWAFPSRRGKGARALTNWDEDSITMAVEATRGLPLAGTEAIAFASTTPPFADLQNATLVAAALGLARTVETGDAGGSLRAGTTALRTALRANRSAIVVAADARRARPGSAQELSYGAGAAAFAIGAGEPVARLIGSAARADPFVDHFRAAGDRFDYYWEERWVRDEGYAKIVPPAVRAALAEAGIDTTAIDHFCLPALQPSLAGAIAKLLGIRAEAVAEPLATNCGDTGAAHGPLMLAAALERAKPGERILVVTFGAGCDVLLFETTEALAAYTPTRGVTAALARGRVEPHYTKLLSFGGELDLDWGMRAEGSEKIPLTQQYRAHDQLATFTAGECPDCGAVQFPQLASCVNCGSFAPLAPRSLADVPAKVASFTADWLQFHPSPPLYFGLVQFENGARVMMEIVDVAPDSLDVGTPLAMVYRIKSRDAERGYARYFWKATPLPPSSQDS